MEPMKYIDNWDSDRFLLACLVTADSEPLPGLPPDVSDAVRALYVALEQKRQAHRAALEAATTKKGGMRSAALWCGMPVLGGGAMLDGVLSLTPGGDAFPAGCADRVKAATDVRAVVADRKRGWSGVRSYWYNRRSAIAVIVAYERRATGESFRPRAEWTSQVATCDREIRRAVEEGAKLGTLADLAGSGTDATDDSSPVA